LKQYSKIKGPKILLLVLSIAVLAYYAKYAKLSLIACLHSVECGKKEAMDITPAVFDMYQLSKAFPIDNFDIHPDIIRADTTQALESRAVEFLYPIRHKKDSLNIFVSVRDSDYLDCYTYSEASHVKLCSKKSQ
jgi:hypothetical protein